MRRITSNQWRRRCVLSGCLAISVVSGCISPSAPPTDGRRSQGSGTVSAGGGTFSGGSDVKPASTGSRVLPTPAASPPAFVAGTTANGQPIDLSMFIVGRVLVPPGILSNNGGGVIGQNTANIVSNNGGSVIGQNTANIVSNNGGSVIGQNTANIVSNNGGSVIGQNTANVIGQNTANIVSNNGGSLGQRPLAYAALRVVDAAGKVKNGKNGQPLVGQADALGQFLVPRTEIDANCVIQVTSPHIEGELKAFVAKGAQTPETELEVDMISTLSATYVLEKFVDGKQEILDRLTPEIEVEARNDIETAFSLGKAPLTTSTKIGVIATALSEIIRLDDGVRDVFDRIEKLLVVAGITRDGEGMIGRSVPLGLVNGILGTNEGVYTFNQSQHRLLFCGPDGKIRPVVPQNGWPYPEVAEFAISSHSGMVMRNGALYLSDTLCRRVVEIRNGVVKVLAGNGQTWESAPGTLATEASAGEPTGLAFDRDGLLYFADSYNRRICRINADGVLQTVVNGGSTETAPEPIPADTADLWGVSSLAFDENDDLLFAVQRPGSRIQKLIRSSNAIIDQVANPEFSEIGAFQYSAGNIYFIGKRERGNSLFKVDTDKVLEIRPSEPQGEEPAYNLIHSPYALAISEDKAYLQLWSKEAISFNLSQDRTPTVLCGFNEWDRSRSDFGSCSAMSVNSVGDIAIADRWNRKVYVIKNNEKPEVVAGNGQQGFISSANLATEVPLGDLDDIVWDTNSSVVIASSAYPAIQRIQIGGTISTLADSEKLESSVIKSDLSTESALRLIDRVLLMNGGNLLSFDSCGNNLKFHSTGALSQYTEWPDLRVTSSIHNYKGNIVTTVWADTNTVCKVSEAGLTPLLSIRELDNLADENKYTVNGAILDEFGCLWVSTETHIYQKNTKTNKVRIFAGKGGIVLNKDSRDSSLRSIKDIEFNPDGDLLILETDQLKRIERPEISYDW